MAWSVSVNGTDLATYGFYLQATGGIFGSSKRTLQKVWIPGRGMLYTSPARVADRIGTLSGGLTTTAKTVTALETAMDQLKSALTSANIRLGKDNGATTPRLIDGYVTDMEVQPDGHPAAATDARVQVTVECPTPYWRLAQPTYRALKVAGTRYEIPLGTAPSTPIIRLYGAGTPVLTYMDASGTAVHTLDLGLALGANDWVEIDMRTNLMTKHATGVTSNITAFTGDFPWAFDPQDGDWSTSQWPLLSTSAGTGAAFWWKSYL